MNQKIKKKRKTYLSLLQLFNFFWLEASAPPLNVKTGALDVDLLALDDDNDSLSN